MKKTNIHDDINYGSKYDSNGWDNPPDYKSNEGTNLDFLSKMKSFNSNFKSFDADHTSFEGEKLGIDIFKTAINPTSFNSNLNEPKGEGSSPEILALLSGTKNPVSSATGSNRVISFVDTNLPRFGQSA